MHGLSEGEVEKLIFLCVTSTHPNHSEEKTITGIRTYFLHGRLISSLCISKR